MTPAGASAPVSAKRWWTGPSFLIGFALTGIIVAGALLSYVWTPYPPTQMMILNRLRPG